MTRLHFDIRPATVADTDRLAAFSEKTFRDAFEALNPQDPFNAYVAAAFTRQQIKKEIEHPSNTFFIAESNGTWTGYAKLSQTPPPGCIKDLPALELARLYVSGQQQGRGIGRRLIKTCLAFARQHNYRSIWLGSWVENQSGNAFYKKMGCRIMGHKTFALGKDIQQDHVFCLVVEQG